MTVHALGSSERPLRTAVVGAGPAGFYTADALLKAKGQVTEVDLFDRLPTPYGLVRFGVAPDHQKIKSVIKGYGKTAAFPGFRFLGNVRVCMGDVTLEQLLEHYHQVVFAVGCETDRRLSIAGEDASGSHAATSFVAWYNGHPDFRDYEVALDCERAAIIGVGDVALDLARMMVRSVEDLATTDIADYALEVFRKSRVREVFIVARRGPAQAAFATKELDDIVALPGVDVRIDPDAVLAAERLGEVDGLTRRKLEFLANLARKPEAQSARRITFRFCAAPVEIEERNGKVSGLKIERTELSVGEDGWVQARGTVKGSAIGTPCSRRDS
jgi:ferredoxin--NADP+ reductase